MGQNAFCCCIFACTLYLVCEDAKKNYNKTLTLSADISGRDSSIPSSRRLSALTSA